jgi:hypothetical protein
MVNNTIMLSVIMFGVVGLEVVAPRQRLASTHLDNWFLSWLQFVVWVARKNPSQLFFAKKKFKNFHFGIR